MASLEQFHVFLKKKGFLHLSSEIYGGLSGFYDYGPLGTLLKQNLESLWRRFFLKLNPNYYEIEPCQIMPSSVFQASGHLQHFLEPLLVCSHCRFSERADHFLSERTKEKNLENLSPQQYDFLIKKHRLTCPLCKNPFQKTRLVNLMFPLSLGTRQTSLSYLRPETAQGAYVNFKLHYEILRRKLPLGLAIIGKAFRNEISPRNLTLRQREFTQAELQIFFNPAQFPLNFKEVKDYPLLVLLLSDRKNQKPKKISCASLKKKFPEWYLYHLAKIQQFFLDFLKIPSSKFRLLELSEKEKAFYNKIHFDIEIDLNFLGFTEVGGLHYRGDHDLKGHQKVSRQKLTVLDENNRHFLPHVLELSLGIDRVIYALLNLNYQENKERGHIILSLPPSLAPFFCAVFPLVKKEASLLHLAQKIYQELNSCFFCLYDDVGSIGRRYARIDEQGVPYALTVDFESLKDNTVTLRNRDTAHQTRIKISHLKEELFRLFLPKPI